MEEVDNIIIHTLKNIGCDIGDEITSIKLFDEELVVKAAVCCLEAITPGTGLPRSLPPSMSLRLRTATLIAQAVKDLGYRGDMGYQTLLYSNEVDVRRMFMFLVERLPRDTDKLVQSKVKGRFELLETEIRQAVNDSLHKIWLPSGLRAQQATLGASRPYRTRHLSAPITHSISISQAKKEYWARYLPLVTEQCTKNQLMPSLISANTEDSTSVSYPQVHDQINNLIKQNANETKEESINDIVITTSEILPKQDNVIEKIQEIDVSEIENLTKQFSSDVEVIKIEIKSLENDLKILNAKDKQLAEQKKMEESLLENTLRQLKIKSRTHKLLPEKDENVTKLEEMLEANTAKLASLAAQWNKHRTTLIKEYRNIREHSTQRESENLKVEERLRIEKQKHRELVDEAIIKDTLSKQLQEDYAKLSNSVNRSAYTRRIMEIIGNIRKQSDEINKILKDTKEVQKEINILNGKLERSFVLADEVIFRDAKHEETSRKAYKLLATLHGDCSELVQVVTLTGAIVRECRDLQEQVDAEQSQDTSARLERITADLEQVRRETTALQEAKQKRDR